MKNWRGGAAVDFQQSWRPWVMLALLHLSYLLATVDRLVIGLLVEPMKAYFQISDTEISLVQGMGFMLTYAITAIPIGLLADRMNRLRLIGAGICIWSAGTALCGMANTYALLLLARLGVGVGEATVVPCAHSLLANGFPRRRLGLAFGIFSLGAIVGNGLALGIGSYLLNHFDALGGLVLPMVGLRDPWQAVFIVLGIPGPLLAALFFIVREPPRRPLINGGEPATVQLRRFYREHWRAVVPHHLAIALTNTALISSMLWIAPFFARVHHWQIAQIGWWVGASNLVSGAIAFIVGGIVSDLLSRYGVTGRLVLCAAMMPIALISVVIFALSDSSALSITMFTLFMTCALLPYGIGGAILQDILPDRTRSAAAAVFLLVVSLTVGLGPTIIAALSDYVFEGAKAIRYSLLVFGIGTIGLAQIFYLSAIPAFKRAARLNGEPI